MIPVSLFVFCFSYGTQLQCLFFGKWKNKPVTNHPRIMLFLYYRPTLATAYKLLKTSWLINDLDLSHSYYYKTYVLSVN